MKVGVFADTHVGRCVPRAIGELRRRAHRRAFTQAVNAFIEEGVDYVVHAGDMFEKRSMTPEDSVFVKEELQRLVDSSRERHGKEVKIFAIRGNHDGAPGSNALDYIRHPLARYLRVVGDSAGDGGEQESEGIRLVGISYHPYIARVFGEMRPAIEERFRLGGKLKLLVLHNFVEGYHKVPPGVPRHGLLAAEELGGIGADLVVAGHYHERVEPMDLDGTSLLTPGATEAVDLSDEGPYGVYVIDGKEIRFVEIEPLHEIRNVKVDSRGAVKPSGWFVENALLGAREYASSVRERGAEGVLRVILIGLTDEDPYEAERRLAQEVQKLKEGSPGLLFVDLVNRIEDVRQPVSMPAFGGGVEFAAKILEPFGRLAPEATKIVEETGTALDEKASQKTGLLTVSDRASFVARWVEAIEKAVGEG